MKKILLIATLLAIVVGGCNKDTVKNITAETKTTIKVTAEFVPETRTYYNGDIIKWSETGEQLNIIYYADDQSSSCRQTYTHEDYNIDADGRIEFTADFRTISRRL